MSSPPVTVFGCGLISALAFAYCSLHALATYGPISESVVFAEITNVAASKSVGAASFNLTRSSPPPPLAAAPQLDGTMLQALKIASPPHRFVMLTFGNSAISDHLLNFCCHARRIRTAYIVGAVDVAAYDLLAAQRIPVYKTPLAHEQYSMDGSNSHSSQSWKRFASMRTGEVARLVHLGYDVLHTDTDVVWLRDPTPYLMCTEAARGGEFKDAAQFPCLQIRQADVAISSDNMGPSRAVKGGGAYHAAGTFNSGILLFRSSANGKRFVSAWHGNVANPPRGSRFVGKTSDQQVINAMLRRDRQWPGVGGKRGEWLMDHLHEDWEGSLVLGALPLPLFSNGHGYFVQRAQVSLKVAPFAVHATYSLDYHDGGAKRQRFREAGLWLSDPDSYFAGKFLALNFSVPPSVHAALVSYRRRGLNPNNIGVHAEALAGYLAELRDALALATALGRTLVLPRWQCYADRLWAGSDNIVGTKFMYPGSQVIHHRPRLHRSRFPPSLPAVASLLTVASPSPPFSSPGRALPPLCMPYGPCAVPARLGEGGHRVQRRSLPHLAAVASLSAWEPSRRACTASRKVRRPVDAGGEEAARLAHWLDCC